MGPSAFGLYGIALAAGSILSIFIDGGMRNVLLREGTLTSKKLSNLAKQLPAIAIRHAITMTVVLSLVALGIFPLHLPLVLSSLVCFLGIVLAQYVSASLRGAGRWSLDAGWQMGHRTLSATFILVVLVLGFAQAWMVLAAWACASFVAFIFFSSPIRTIPNSGFNKEVYKVALPLVLIDLGTAVYFRSDILLMGWMGIDSKQIGQYAASYRILEAVIMAANPIGLLLFRVIRQNKGNQIALKKALQRNVILAIIFGGGGALTIGLISEQLVAWTYGSSFPESAKLISVLSWSLVFIFPNTLLTQASLALELDRSYMWAAIFVAFANLIFNCIAIERYGSLASAYITVATEGILFLLLSLSIFLKSD